MNNDDIFTKPFPASSKGLSENNGLVSGDFYSLGPLIILSAPFRTFRQFAKIFPTKGASPHSPVINLTPAVLQLGAN